MQRIATDIPTLLVLTMALMPAAHAMGGEDPVDFGTTTPVAHPKRDLLVPELSLQRGQIREGRGVPVWQGSFAAQTPRGLGLTFEGGGRLDSDSTIAWLMGGPRLALPPARFVSPFAQFQVGYMVVAGEEGGGIIPVAMPGIGVDLGPSTFRLRTQADARSAVVRRRAAAPFRRRRRLVSDPTSAGGRPIDYMIVSAALKDERRCWAMCSARLVRRRETFEDLVANEWG